MSVTVYEFTAVHATTGEPLWPATTKTLLASQRSVQLQGATVYAVITANMDSLIAINATDVAADAGGSLLERNQTVGLHVTPAAQPYVSNRAFER